MSPCQPGVEGYSAMKSREVLEMEDMAAINTHYPSGDTYYGPSSSSRMDYICMPVGMLHNVGSCNVLHRLGKSMQMISPRDMRDHMPLMVEADMMLDSGSEVLEQHVMARIRWNHDALAAGFKNKYQKREFLSELEETVAPYGADWHEMLGSPTPDAAWRRLHDDIKELATRRFTKPVQKSEQYQRDTQTRLRLIGERAVARENNDGPLESGMELCRAPRACRRERRRVDRERKDRLLEQLWEAWRVRDFSVVWRCARALSGNNIGPKKRFYNEVRGSNPTKQEWSEFLEKEGRDGGLKAREIDFELELDKGETRHHRSKHGR